MAIGLLMFSEMSLKNGLVKEDVPTTKII